MSPSNPTLRIFLFSGIRVVHAATRNCKTETTTKTPLPYRRWSIM